MQSHYRINIREETKIFGYKIRCISMRLTKSEDDHYGILYLKFTKRRRHIVYHDTDLLNELSDYLRDRGIRFKELNWTEKGMQTLDYSTFDIEM